MRERRRQRTARLVEDMGNATSTRLGFVAFFVSMAGGLVLAASYVVGPLSIPVFVISMAAWLGGIGVIGWLAAAEARSTGLGFWRSLGRGIRISAKSLWHFFP